VAKIFEVRYKNDKDEIVCNQHAGENTAKIDAKAISREKGRALLGEIDYEKNLLIRVCEYQGGVQGRWENRNGPATPCKIMLTLEETKQDEPSIQPQTKSELTDEEKEEKRKIFERLREAAKKKEEDKPKREPSKTTAIPSSDKREKLAELGCSRELIECICTANLHIDSPSFNALCRLWVGDVTGEAFPGMDAKALNAMMMKLRTQLVSCNTGKSIVTAGKAKDLTYRLIDFKLEIIEDEVA
jgi:hypothetical protein